MVTLFDGKAAVSDPTPVYPVRWSSGASVGEWTVMLGFTLPDFFPAVFAMRWDGDRLHFGEIVVLPSDVYATGRDGAVREGAAILWPQIDTGTAHNTMHVYTANNDGTVRHEQVDVPITPGYSVSASLMWGTYYGDMFVMFQSLGADVRADKFRVEVDGSITPVGTDTHASSSGMFNVPPVYGAHDGGTANPAGNVLLWPCISTDVTNYRTIAIDLEGDVFSPVICTPVFYTDGFTQRWIDNDDPVSRRVYPGQPHGRDRVPGGNGFQMLTFDNYGIDSWRWTGSDVEHVSLTSVPPSPQLAGRGVDAFYPLAHSEQWLGKVGTSNEDGSESWAEIYWPHDAPALSALVETDGNGTGPGIKVDAGLGTFFEVEPGVVLFAAFNSDSTACTIYRFAFAAPLPYVLPARATPSLRMLQRGGSGGMSGIPRMVGDPTRRGSLRQGPGSIY